MKIQVKNYTFNAGAKTITFTDYVTIDLNSVLLIANVTSQIIIYNFADTLKGGTAATNVLTLEFDTTAMNNTDKLQIWYWDVTIGVAVSNFPANYALPTGQLTTLTPPAAITGFALEAGGNLDSICSFLASIDSKFTDPLPVSFTGGGDASEATLATRLSESDFDDKIGSLTETAPSTDTASSGLNGRLQRLLQRITTFIGLFPSSIGQKTKADSLSVTFPSNVDTVPVSGTFFQATQPVSGTVTANAGMNLNTSALATEATLALIKAKTDNIDVALSTRTKPADVQSISVSSLPLPSGASTETTLALIKAKTDNIPAQGQALAAGSLPVVLTAIQQTALTPPAAITGFATETTLGTRLSESDFDTKTGSLTETAPASDTASSGLNGRLQRIAQRITTLISSILTVKTDQTTHGTTDLVAADITKINGVTPLMGNGATGTGSPRVTVSNDNSPIPVKIDQTTPGTTNAVRNIAGATGGATPYFLISAASTNATSLKGSAGTITGIQVYNINAAVRYLKLYNKATAPTVGSDTPVKVIAIPGGGTVGAGSNVPISSVGVAFTTGIAFALTTGIANADTGAVAASEILVNIDYN